MDRLSISAAPRSSHMIKTSGIRLLSVLGWRAAGAAGFALDRGLPALNKTQATGSQMEKNGHERSR